MNSMENRQKARIERGWIPAGYELSWRDKSTRELISLLENRDAIARTAAARLLGQRGETLPVPALCARLQKETALYSRLAAAEALVQIGEPVLPRLVFLLGRIGQNQHTSLPTRGFYKRSFPLPRDLAARVLIRAGTPALPFLERVVQDGEPFQAREAVDAIGHIALTTMDTRSERVLITAFRSASNDPILRWKLIRAFRSFSSPDTREILMDVILNDSHPELRWEAVRSLGLMKEIPPDVLEHARNDPDVEVRSMARLFMG